MQIQRAFKAVTAAAGIGEDWTPRELRHSFVSLLSAEDVPTQVIADLVGHSGTAVTETVYRHELRPVLPGAAVIDRLFPAEGATGAIGS